MALGIGLLLLLIFALRGSPASLIIGVFLLVAVFPGIRFGMRVAERGRRIPALAIVSASTWSMVLLTGARGPIGLVIGLPLLVIPMILALPHVSSRGLFRIAMGATAVCAGAVALTLPGPLLPSSLSASAAAALAVPLTIVTTGLALLSLWQVGSRLRASISETQAANVALAESERSLERKVEERTAELEEAVAETSAVQEIVAAASSTLDPQEVLRTVLASVRRVVPFDQAGVMLLDEERQRLVSADLVGSGALPEFVDRLKQISIPLDETNSAFAYVVRKNRSFLLREIDDETVRAMSPSDRQVYDAAESRPKALFISPLEIDHEAVGVFYLGKTDGVFDLDEKALATVHSYIPHLSTAIRNARLFDETQRLHRSLAAAEERIDKLAESAADALDDVATWASEVATEVAAAIGAREIAVWVREGDRLERLVGSTTAELTVQDLETLTLTGKPVARDGDRVVPVVGLTGETRAALVVAAAGASVGAEGERLIGGFARHLGSTLELMRMRRDLAEAGERRRATAEEMLERGVNLLCADGVNGATTRRPRSARTIRRSSTNRGRSPIALPTATDFSTGSPRVPWGPFSGHTTSVSSERSRSRSSRRRSSTRKRCATGSSVRRGRWRASTTQRWWRSSTTVRSRTDRSTSSWSGCGGSISLACCSCTARGDPETWPPWSVRPARDSRRPMLGNSCTGTSSPPTSS